MPNSAPEEYKKLASRYELDSAAGRKTTNGHM